MAALADYSPGYQLDAGGEPSGFAIDVMNRLARRAHLVVEYVVMQSWSEAHSALKAGRVDVIPNMGITERRRPMADFTVPVETFPVSVFVRESETAVKGDKDLPGCKVAVVGINVGYSLLRSRKDVELVLTQNPSEAVMLVLSGQADALVYPEPVINMLTRKAGIDQHLKAVGPPLKVVSRGVAVAKGRPELLQRLDAATREFVTSQEYRDIYAKWYGEPAPYWTGARVTLTIAFAVGGCIAFALFWRYRCMALSNRQLREEMLRREDETRRRIDAEDIYKDLFKSMNVGVVYQDASGTITTANEAAQRILGVTLEEMTGRTSSDAEWRAVNEDGSPLSLEGHPAMEALRTGREIRNTTMGVFNPREDAYRWIMVNAIPRFRNGETKPFQVFTTFQDITKRVNAQHELRSMREDLEERVKERTEELRSLDRTFVSLLENTTDFLYFKDTGLRFTAVSQTMAELTGFEHWTDMLGKHDLEVFPGEIGQAYYEEELPVIRDGAPLLNLRQAYRMKNGEWGWVHTNKWPLIDSGGRVTGLFGISRDITNLVRTEEELLENQQRLGTLLRVAPVGIYETDKDGNCLYVNEHWTRFSGMNLEEAKGTGWLWALHPDDREKVGHEWYAAAKENRVFEMDYRFRNRLTDKVTWLIGRASKLTDKYGETIGYIGTVLDITGRKAVEEALRAKEQRLDTLLKVAPVGLAMIQDRRIVMCNEYLGTIVGYTPEELLGQETRLLYLSDGDWERVGEKLARELHPGQVLHFEMQLRRKDGRAVDGLMSCSLLEVEKGVPAMMAALYDMSEQKAAERRIRAANEELDQYAYVVSHDLKSPLRAILNYALFIREDMKGRELPGEVELYLDGLSTAVEQCEELVDDLLELSRIGRKFNRPEAVDLEQLVEEVVSEHMQSSPFTFDGPEEWPVVQGSPVLVRQVFSNLFSNALKFNESGEKNIVIRWKEIPGQGIEVAVQDNGIGMEERYLEQVFQVFQRLHTRSEYEGTGIGLAIVKKAVETLGGDIRVESKPGTGSTFFVLFPEHPSDPDGNRQ